VSATDSPRGTDPYNLRKFKPNFEALGLVLEFLSRQPPFAGFILGHLMPAVRHQIAHGHHVCAFRGETLVGYCGWLPIGRDVGEQWLRGGELRPGSGAEADAVALTIVRTDEPAALRHLIRACRNAEPGKRFFFKREYANGLRRTRYQSIRDIG
jgi:hypothetical protein